MMVPESSFSLCSSWQFFVSVDSILRKNLSVWKQVGPLQCQYFVFPDSELAWQRAMFSAWFVNVLLGVGKGKQGRGGGGENCEKYQIYTKVERII